MYALPIKSTYSDCSPARVASPSDVVLSAEGVSEGEEWWPVYLHPNLRSTRSLERFRNQVSRELLFFLHVTSR